MNPAGGVWARWPMGTEGAAGALSAISETAHTKNPNSSARRSALDASSADVITSAYPGSFGEPQASRPPHNAKRVDFHVGQRHTRTRSIRVVESPARPLPGRPSDPFRVVSFRRQRGVVSRASPDAGALLRAPRGVDDVPRAGVALEPFPPRQHRPRVGVPRRPPADRSSRAALRASRWRTSAGTEPLALSRRPPRRTPLPAWRPRSPRSPSLSPARNWPAARSRCFPWRLSPSTLSRASSSFTPRRARAGCTAAPTIPNNVFNVAFRTTPVDSTGVAHILEHTALCGSEIPNPRPLLQHAPSFPQHVHERHDASDYRAIPSLP